MQYEKLLHYNKSVEKTKEKRGTDMKFAMIGLGKMGLNLVKNAVDNGHEAVASDLSADSVKEADSYSDAVTGVTNLDDMLAALPSPKVVWVMVPAGKPTN